MNDFTVLHGDCLEEIGRFEAGSLDSCVTDPPYGLAFMGKKWDKFTAGDIAMRRNPEMDAVNTGASRQGGRQRACADYQKRQARDARAFQAFSESWAREVFRVLKPGAHLLAFGGTRTYHRMVCAIEDAGFEIRDQIGWLYGSGFPKSHNLKNGHTGWGTALKPAWEPIVVARKPLLGTVAQNVQQFGTGAINVDACRVAGSPSGLKPYKRAVEQRNSQVVNHKDVTFTDHAQGRWPANIIHDGSEEVLTEFAKGGSNKGAVAPVTRRGADKFRGCYGEFAGEEEAGETFQGDTGTAARFFYCAKASKRDRDEGLEAFAARQTHDRKPDGKSVFESSDQEPRRNHHPTVKPTALMRYLVRLVTPPGGTVLDPFMGSGSTGRGARLEGFGFIGIERERDYCEIAEARIKEVAA